jgi:1,4-alpha-glucan branching enzyme
MAKKNNTMIKTSFSLLAPLAREVLLVGDFTEWEKAPVALKKGKDGSWSKDLSLAPGEHEYRFIVDGEWTTDPHAQVWKGNPYGSDNAVKHVSG